MKIVHDLINFIIKILLQIVCRIDAEELKKVPEKGPLILAANHVNFLEIPLVYIWLQPRPVDALVKIESMNRPFISFLMKLWGGIPVRRGEFDRQALMNCIDSLNDGNILAVAVEGTRSGDGRLLKGYPGVIPIALKSDAPILPVVFYGHENFWKNITHLKRTRFKIAVGEPFKIKDNGLSMSRDIRQDITDQIMYRLAVLLPEEFRGVYADTGKMDDKYFTFSTAVEIPNPNKP